MNFPDFDESCVSFWKQSPTRHSLSAVFLLGFWQKKPLFNFHMSALTLPQGKTWLSCDHTFRTAANIGLVRQADSKWINQFKGLFCVLNSCGQVLTWRLTSSLAFSNVENLLVLLHQRLQSQGITVEHFYVDNCCAWRSKLQKVFGIQLQVYLDLFHAVQRISSKISKRHPFHHNCMKDL